MIQRGHRLKTTERRELWGRPGPTSGFTSEEAEKWKGFGQGHSKSPAEQAHKNPELLTPHPFLANKWAQAGCHQQDRTTAAEPGPHTPTGRGCLSRTWLCFCHMWGTTEGWEIEKGDMRACS